MKEADTRTIHCDVAVECPMQMLGTIKPPENLDITVLQTPNKDTVVNGVTLSRQTMEELQRLGIPLHWYHPGELQDAIIACHYDGTLIDDPGGVHFRDKLHLGPHESNADQMHGYAHARQRMRVRTLRHFLLSSTDIEDNARAFWKKQSKKHSPSF